MVKELDHRGDAGIAICKDRFDNIFSDGSRLQTVQPDSHERKDLYLRCEFASKSGSHRIPHRRDRTKYCPRFGAWIRAMRINLL